MKTIEVVAAIIKDDEKILITRRADGEFTLNNFLFLILSMFKRFLMLKTIDNYGKMSLIE